MGILVYSVSFEVLCQRNLSFAVSFLGMVLLVQITEQSSIQTILDETAFLISSMISNLPIKGVTLESRIDLEKGINVGLWKFGQK